MKTEKKQYRLKRWYPSLISMWKTHHSYEYDSTNGWMSNIDAPSKMRLNKREVESDYWEEVKQPLFITEDGVELFNESDKLFIVNKEYYKKESKISNLYDKANRKYFKYFFHESNADEYIWKNKPVFSYEDFRRWGNVPYDRVIMKLAKERTSKK